MPAAVLVPTASCPAASPGRSYARREPENSVLHVVVREHLETFLTTVREERGKDLPHYVEQELRRYLRCGILAHGFCRVVCPSCRKEILVAYSCKCRGACDLCFVAAHLVDLVGKTPRMVEWRGPWHFRS